MEKKSGDRLRCPESKTEKLGRSTVARPGVLTNYMCRKAFLIGMLNCQHYKHKVP